MRFRSPGKWFAIAPALATGLALRLFFVFKFPAGTTDGPLYEALAHNWREMGIYGLNLNGGVVPVDIRMPGYPAFLATISYVLGRGETRVMLAQVAVDLCTCVLAAMLAGLLAPAEETGRPRSRLQIAAVWLAALCPFLANYSAAVLTEVLATFLTTVALLAFVSACTGAETFSFSGAFAGSGQLAERKGFLFFLRNSWFVGGLAVGLGTLARPETPLLLIALALLLLWKWRRRADWVRLFRVTALIAVGFILPLVPWTVRNAVSLHEFQPLAPRYAQLPGEVPPRGFYAWTNTWLTRYRQIDPTIWKLDDDQIDISAIPDAAFDAPDERTRVDTLIEQYNKNCCDVTPSWDAQFAELASERTARRPLRTHFSVPFTRALTVWFTPRVEILPYSGNLFPLRKSFHEDPVDFSVTLLFGAFGIIYVALALAGTLRIFVWRRALFGPQLWAAGLLVIFCVVRTAFITHIETPEPRYVLECFPAVFALAAVLWSGPAR
jgi:4-amino-4-deoxy-L-arabinose transferase-like glycosyltransferase